MKVCLLFLFFFMLYLYLFVLIPSYLLVLYNVQYMYYIIQI